MVEEEWKHFMCTGSVRDYLAYSHAHEAAEERSGMTNSAKESEPRDGADHCAYRYGVGGNSHRGL